MIVCLPGATILTLVFLGLVGCILTGKSDSLVDPMLPMRLFCTDLYSLVEDRVLSILGSPSSYSVCLFLRSVLRAMSDL